MNKINIRVSPEEYEHIKAEANKSAKTMSAYCRDVLMNHTVQDTLPRQSIAKIMCIYHNRIDDAATMEEAKTQSNKMEAAIWQLIK
jgi:uncharacterized protein (DUF1778 family)